MNFHIVTLFPEVIDAYAEVSILGRAQKILKKGGRGKEMLLSVTSYQLRDFVTNKWGKADERPYGGGPGMVLQAEGFARAVAAIQKKISRRRSSTLATVKPRTKKTKILIMAAGGTQLTNAYAKKLAKEGNVIILCGRYEGIDARVAKIASSLNCSVEEVSVGPYILTGGELPALTIIDTTARQIPGVLGTFSSLEEERVASHDVYTRPEVFEFKDAKGRVKRYSVPSVLLSGNHALKDAWKEQKRSKPL